MSKYFLKLNSEQFKLFKKLSSKNRNNSGQVMSDRGRMIISDSKLSEELSFLIRKQRENKMEENKDKLIIDKKDISKQDLIEIKKILSRKSNEENKDLNSDYQKKVFNSLIKQAEAFNKLIDNNDSCISDEEFDFEKETSEMIEKYEKEYKQFSNIVRIEECVISKYFYFLGYSRVTGYPIYGIESNDVLDKLESCKLSYKEVSLFEISKTIKSGKMPATLID